MRRVALVSGGLDSTLCVFLYMNDSKAGNEDIYVFIDYGQPYMNKELDACKDLFGVSLQVLRIDLGLNNEAQSPFIRTRNLMLACIVNARYNPDQILIAGLKDDVVEDKNPQAFEEMSKIISVQSKAPVEVISPFWNLTKGDLVAAWKQRAEADGIGMDLLYRTISCYDHNPGFCGECPACFRWYVAMRSNGLEPRFNLSKRIMVEYLRKIHTYDPTRIFHTLRALAPQFGHVVAAWDIDGVLTKETKGHDYANRTPMRGRIEEVNAAYEAGEMVVLTSSRFERDRAVTERWLMHNGVSYHALLLEKIPYTTLVDDRAFPF